MGSRDNLAAVLYGPNDMRLEQRPVPELADNQVVLRMESVGICGSDVHYYAEGHVGPFVVEQPMIIGHEASGTVVRTGKDVKNLKLGDRVAIEPGVSCRTCKYCKEGNYHLCPDMKFCATPPIDGNLQRFYVHDADFCFKLPDNLSFDDGALVEPLAVAVHSCKKGRITFGDSVLVLGAGPVGLATAAAAKAYGATKVLITGAKNRVFSQPVKKVDSVHLPTDLLDYRLEIAAQLEIHSTLKVSEDTTVEAIVNKVKEILGEEPCVSIDCVGAESCVRVALEVTRPGGVVVLVGMAQFEMTLPLAAALTREVDIRGVFRYNNDYPAAIELMKSGAVDLEPLITHHFVMEDAVLAFKTAKSGQGNPIKIIINPNEKENSIIPPSEYKKR